MAILLLLASAAQGQVQAPDKAYIEQIPRNILRPSISLPASAPSPAAVRPTPPPAVNPTRPAAGLPAARPALQPRAAEPARRTAATAPRPAAATQTSAWACQIRAGTFSQRANADNLAKALKPLGETRVSAMQVGGKPVHLVTIVGLGTRKNAELVLARLKASGRDLGALSIAGCRT